MGNRVISEILSNKCDDKLLNFTLSTLFIQAAGNTVKIRHNYKEWSRDTLKCFLISLKWHMKSKKNPAGLIFVKSVQVFI